MKKKAIILFATLFILTMPVLSAKTITATLDGKEIVFDQAPMIENGRTIVPVRAIMEALGLTMEYDSASSTATGTSEAFKIIFTAGQDVAYVNEVAKKLEVPAKLIGSRMYIPLRFLSEEMGIGVTWDPNNYKIILDSTGKSTIIDKTPVVASNVDDLKGEYHLNFPTIKNFLYNSGINVDKYLTVKSNTAKKLQYILVIDGDNGTAVDLANAAMDVYDIFINGLFDQGKVLDYKNVDTENYFSEIIYLNECTITMKMTFVDVDKGGGGEFDFIIDAK